VNKNEALPTLNERMDAAFDNYFALSKVLQDDLLALLESETNSQHWRRNYIRVSVSLIEGYAHCLRDMCIISLDCVAPQISSDETKVLKSEGMFSTNDRIKLTLRVAYKLFELEPAPNFGGAEWASARYALDKRSLLMHPKTPIDMEISDKCWADLDGSTTWLIKQLFNFASLLQKKYGD